MYRIGELFMTDYKQDHNQHDGVKTDLDWWQNKICCPRCGKNIYVDGDLNICSHCQLGFQMDKNILCWERSDFQTESVYGWKRYYEGVKYRLDPMASPYSPLVVWTKHLVDDYYSRTLWDKHLAQDWKQHYLDGLNLSSGANVLDHGCGRGRNIGLLSQLGLNVAGQEIENNTWWDNFPRALVQVVSPGYHFLPWRDQSFNLVLDVGVIGHFQPDLLEEYCKEVQRVLVSGGYWLILEANSKGYGAWMPRKHYGRLYSLKQVQAMAFKYGLEEVDHSYEGFYAPIFPRFLNFLRKQCFRSSFDMYDYGSRIEKFIPEERRGLWLLRLQKGRAL